MKHLRKITLLKMLDNRCGVYPLYIWNYVTKEPEAYPNESKCQSSLPSCEKLPIGQSETLLKWLVGCMESGVEMV